MKQKEPKRVKAFEALVSYKADIDALEARRNEERTRDERAYKTLCNRREAAYQRAHRNRRIRYLNALNLLSSSANASGEPDPDFDDIFSLSRPLTAAARPPARAPECYPQVIVAAFPEANRTNYVAIDTAKAFAASHVLGHEAIRWSLPIEARSWAADAGGLLIDMDRPYRAMTLSELCKKTG
jgi:hypothetical protein